MITRDTKIKPFPPEMEIIPPGVYKDNERMLIRMEVAPNAILDITINFNNDQINRTVWCKICNDALLRSTDIPHDCNSWTFAGKYL